MRIEVTSAKDSTFAVRRDTAKGSKNRTISIKGMFKAAIKAITQRDDDAPRLRRRGQKEGGGAIIMMRLAHAAGRPAARGRYAALRRVKTAAAQIPGGFVDAAEDMAAQVYADTGLYLADTCAWLQAWENNADCVQMHDDHFSAIQDQYFPQP